MVHESDSSKSLNSVKTKEIDLSRNSKRTKSIMITSKYSNKDYIKQKTKLSYISSKSDIKKSSSKTDTVEKKATPAVHENITEKRIIYNSTPESMTPLPESEDFDSIGSNKQSI